MSDGSRRAGQDATRLRVGIGVGIIALLLVSTLAVGTVHDATRAAVFLGAAALLAATIVERLRSGKRFPITVPQVALGAAAAMTLLQLLPLPAFLVSILSPRAHQTFQLSLGDYRFHALTLDPAASIAEVAKIGCYLAFFCAVVTFASRRPRRELVIVGIVTVAAINAVIGMLQAAFGTKHILFFYKAEVEFGTLVRGTFVNPNHFGALMCLAAPCALALALGDATRRKYATVALILTSAGAVLSLGRASFLALVIGLGLTLLFSRVYRRDRTPVGPRFWVTAIAAPIFTVALAISVGSEQLRGIWEHTSLTELQDKTSKYHAWGQALRLVLDFPWTGVGRGAFEHAFTRVSDAAGTARFVWIENGYLQALVDWGMPGGMLLIVLAGWGLIVAFKRLRHDALLIGPLAGILALGAHQMVDFAVELPGVALPALAALATLFARRSSEAEAGRRRVDVARTWLLVPAAIALAVVADLATNDAIQDGARLVRVTSDRSRPIDEVLALGTKLRQRHPADYFIPLVVGERLMRTRHPDTIRWLNAAMFLNPQHPEANLAAAEFLAARGMKSQALLEYRAAAEKSRDARPVWEAVLQRYPAFDDLINAAPRDPARLKHFAEWIGNKGRRADHERTLLRILDGAPRDESTLIALTRSALDKRDLEGARRRVRDLQRGPEATRLEVELKMIAGQLDEAQRQLDASTDRSAASFELHLAIADTLSRAGQAAQGRARLEKLEATWPLERDLRAKLHEARAILEERAGNTTQARWERQRRDDLLAK